MITLNKARRLLGKTGKKMSDDQIINLESRMRMFANLMLDRIVEDWQNGKRVYRKIKKDYVK